MDTKFWWENLREEKQDLDIDGIILLQVRKCVQGIILSELSVYYSPCISNICQKFAQYFNALVIFSRIL